MNRLLRATLPCTLAVSLLAAACSSVTKSTPKTVLSESVCASTRFLDLKLNQTNRVVLDNRVHSDQQLSMTVTLEKFPVTVKGEVPQGSIISDKLSTIRLKANAGEQASVDLVPNFTGTYKATCGVSSGNASNTTTRSTDISFQIK